MEGQAKYTYICKSFIKRKLSQENKILANLIFLHLASPEKYLKKYKYFNKWILLGHSKYLFVEIFFLNVSFWERAQNNKIENN